MARKNPGHAVPEIPEGERARDVYARHMQHVLGEQYDNDFSHLSVAETIDSIEYFVFPNAFFFPGLQIPLCYRFRPDGSDPDRCIFEVLYLQCASSLLQSQRIEKVVIAAALIVRFCSI